MPSFIITKSLNNISLGPEWTTSTKFNSIYRIVTEQGKPISADYKGRQYIIVDKKERTFSTAEQIGRLFLGTLLVTCTLSLGLFVKPIRNLFTKTKQNIRFGIPLPSPSDIPTRLNPLPLHTSTTSDNSPKKVDSSSYLTLKNELKKTQATLYVTDETGKYPKTLLNILGNGGSKRAFQLEGNRALILPNMDIDRLEDIAKRWERIVLEEVKMSEILTRIGLLSPSSVQVHISLSTSSEKVIPAYICETFESLSLKDCFVIDAKNHKSSTWKREENFLFHSDDDRLKVENWDAVFDTALTDIAKICYYNIPNGIDSLNLAVVKNPKDSSICPHQVRYFGFDFSSKRKALVLPNIENPSPVLHPSKIRTLLDHIIDKVFTYEFGDRFDYGPEHGKLTKLKEQLVERYTTKVIERAKILSVA